MQDASECLIMPPRLAFASLRAYLLNSLDSRTLRALLIPRTVLPCKAFMRSCAPSLLAICAPRTLPCVKVIGPAGLLHLPPREDVASTPLSKSPAHCSLA